MPILAKEQDVYPVDLLDRFLNGDLAGQQWYAMYTRSRREKEMMRRLRALDIAHCAPMIARPTRSPQGRIRTSHVPLFSNYVFVCGDDADRYTALTTNCVSRDVKVVDGLQLASDLERICQLIDRGHRLSPEPRLQPGALVRVRSGLFAGFEGTILRRDNERRLLLAVRFMEQGASVVLDDCEVERID
ncbi:MAG: KOW motif-containing protein [Pirellulales bacterium]|nr:KOW motif-containing protein [Pirellulales bacterium]